MKNEKLLHELNFDKVEHSKNLPIELQYKEKYQKNVIDIGITDDEISLAVNQYLKVKNTDENIYKINMIGELLRELFHDTHNQEWMGLTKVESLKEVSNNE